ncbi:uncharacterized protein LOC141717046 [Apium graveolens]|uniref:uncharacterized protein LOC141717046 n=1 Tax=Apium graveolens TaxID=4045 RepID=UPI003D7A4690
MEIKRDKEVRWSKPLKADPNKLDKSKYCRFHKDAGHDTDECKQLKDEIEFLIRKGKLSKYTVDGGDRNNNGRRNFEDRKRDQDDQGRNPQPRGPVINAIFGGPQPRGLMINTIFGGPTDAGSSKNSRKAYTREVMHIVGEAPKRARTGVAMTFDDFDLEEVKFPHDDPLVITPIIGNSPVKRVLVDNGASVDILLYDTYIRMGYNDSQLTPTDMSIYGFAGVECPVEGIIKLPITIGQEPRQATQMLEFVVVKAGSTYNAIMGRTGIHTFKAVPSSYHSKLTGRVAALGRFISKSGDKCLPFFKALKKVKDFVWTDESQGEFESLKQYMLVISQVKGEFEAIDETMTKYVRLARAVITQFDECHVEHIPREENAKADALSKFASSEVEKSSGNVYFRVLKPRSIDVKLVAPIGFAGSWIDPIKAHLQTGWLPNDALEARKLSVRALRYSLIDGILYKRSFVIPYLRCLRPDEARLALEKVHEGICGQHLGGKALAHKITRLGFYWPEMMADAKDYVKRCDRCQKHAPVNEIELRFTSVAHPQANGQAKVANRIILDGLKKRIEKSRNDLVDEILSLLWAYRTTCRVTTRATPFMLAYGAEAVVPVKILHSSPRIQAYNAEENEEGQRLALDLIDEVRDEAHAKIVEYPKKASFYYNLRVKEKFYKQGDMVLRKVEASGVGQRRKLAPNWEGPYKIKSVQGRGSYKLETMDDESDSHLSRGQVGSKAPGIFARLGFL